MAVQNQKTIKVNGFAFVRSCNQDILIINKEKVDKDFLQINNAEWMGAVKSFKNNSTGYMYLYLASNCDNYTFALSSSDVNTKLGIGLTAYKNAKKELIEKGYLIPKTQEWKDLNNIVMSDKDTGECYDFHTTPQVIVSQTNDTVIVPQTNEKTVIVPQTNEVIVSQTNTLCCDTLTPCIVALQQIDNIDKINNLIDRVTTSPIGEVVTKDQKKEEKVETAARVMDGIVYMKYKQDIKDGVRPSPNMKVLVNNKEMFL